VAVSKEEVVALYEGGQGLTMQEIGVRVGVSKSRVQQILVEAGVDTDHRHRRTAPRPTGQDDGKKYRAYQMTPATRAVLDLLSVSLDQSRASIVTEAIEEFADRRVPGWRDTVAAAAGRAAAQADDRAASHAKGSDDAARPAAGAETGATRRERKAATTSAGAAEADAGQAGGAGKPRRTKHKGGGT